MRHTLVVSSVGIHIAVVAGFFVAGLWSLEQLDAPRARLDLAVSTQPPAAASGSPAAAKAEPFKRKHRAITKDIVQPDKHHDADKLTATAPGEGSGGTGSGAGSGSGTDPIGTGTCTEPPCGDAPVPPAPRAAPPLAPVMVPPTVIRGLRISGETQIQPPAPVKTAMLRDGKTKVIAALRLCIDPAGEVDNVAVLKSSGYGGYDTALTSALGGWRYRAYQVDGRKVPVCGVVTFIYTIQ